MKFGISSTLPTIVVAIFSASLLAGQVCAFTFGPMLPEYLYNHKLGLPISLGGVIEKFAENAGPTIAGYHNSNSTTAGQNVITVTATDLSGKPVTTLKLDTSYNLTLTASPNGTVNNMVNIDGALVWGQNSNGTKVGKFIGFPPVFSYYPYSVKQQGIVHNQVLSNNSQVNSIIYRTPKYLHGEIILIGGLAVTDAEFGFWGTNFTVSDSSSSHYKKHYRRRQW